MKNYRILKLSLLGSLAGLMLSGCASTIYGIPKAEWDTLSPREKQQLTASADTSNGGQKPGILQIFQKKKLPPEQQAKQDLARGNNGPPQNMVNPP